MSQLTSRWFRRLAVPGLCLGLCFAVSVSGRELPGNRALQVAIVDNYLPCSDEIDDLYEGLSIDVWRRVAERLNMAYTLTTIPTFSEALDAAAEGKVDLVASCHKITPERLKRVELSVPYTRDSLGMLSRRNRVMSLSAARRLIEDETIRVSLLVLLVMSGLSASVLSRILSNFEGLIGFIGSPGVRFTQAWIMLFLGIGLDKMLNKSQRAQAVILLSSVVRILFLSVLVGSTASLIFVKRRPLDANLLTASQLRTVLAEGVAVNAGTKMHDWLLEQIDQKNLTEAETINLLAVRSQGAFEQAISSGKVRHIVSDVSVLNHLIRNLEDSDQFRLSLEMTNKTPQGFIFGAGLPEEFKKEINIAIASMNYDGDSAELELNWQK